MQNQPLADSASDHAVQNRKARNGAGKAQALSSGTKKKKYKSASMIDTDDEEPSDSENTKAQRGAKTATSLRAQSLKEDESSYWREKRKNIARNAKLLEALDIQNGVKTLFNGSDGADQVDRDSSKKKKVGIKCFELVLVLILIMVKSRHPW